MAFQPAPTKQAALDRLGTLLGSVYNIKKGSTLPKEAFEDVARKLGLSPKGSMPVLGERIANAAGLTWDDRHDSRRTPSRGGSTVTREGINTILEALERVLGASSAPAPPGSTLGRPYVRSTRQRSTRGFRYVNLDALDEATAAHQRLEEEVEAFARTRGVSPRRSVAGEPDYDIAWEHAGRIVVVEVKSVNKRNHRQQVRLGIGQILEYQIRMASVKAPSPVEAVLVLGDAASRLDRDVGRAAGVNVLGRKNLHRLVSLGLLP